MKIWKMRYEGRGERREGAGGEGSGYDRSSMMLRQVEAFRVLQAGIGQNGKVAEVVKACGPVISYVRVL